MALRVLRLRRLNDVFVYIGEGHFVRPEFDACRGSSRQVQPAVHSPERSRMDPPPPRTYMAQFRFRDVRIYMMEPNRALKSDTHL